MNVNLQEIINKLQTAKGELQKQQRFAQFATGLDEIISHTSEPLMLMVMGSFSTGKSSFINALVGEEIAAVEAKPTTAVVTKLCYGKQDKLLLHFRDGRVQPATPQEFTRMTAVNDEEKLNEIHEKLDYVERQMPLDMLKQVSIIDSPGLNDVKEKRSEATERFVSKADTVLWMFSVVQLATREEMAAMDRLTPRLKPIAVVNKMDLLDEEEDDPAEFLAKARQTLKGRVQAVVGISAKYELAGKKENNALKREIGNFAELEKAVADLVLPHREKFKLNTLLDELGTYFAAFNREFAKAKEENEAHKSGNYAVYMQNEEKFMQLEDILANVISGMQDYCEREAGRNNEQALFLIGVLYDAGIGVLQDTEKALKFYQKAALKKHQGAMLNMYNYYNDNGADETAEYWLQKLAEQGLPEAQHKYINLLRTQEKYEEYFVWCEKLSGQGDVGAQYKLAECLSKGIGCAVNELKAVNLYRQIVGKWNKEAQFTVAENMYNENNLLKHVSVTEIYELSINEQDNYNINKSINGAGGDTPCKKEAHFWYKKLAEQGYIAAEKRLAECLYEGIVCAKNLEEVLNWYQKAYKQGLKSVAPAIEKIKAELQVEEYRKKAEKGDVQAQYLLAQCLEKEAGCQKNIDDAFMWYEKAAEGGLAEAQNKYAEVLQKENKYEEALKWYKIAAKQGNEHAKKAVKILAPNKLDKNFRNIFEVAQAGNEYAQYIIAEKLYYGIDCIVNKDEALKWYKLAASKGHVDARKKLESLSINASQAVQNESSNDKITNLRKAAERGDVVSQNILGDCLYYGRDCQKDLKEALKWYRKAAEQGYVESEYSLAYCLDKGIGCLLNYKEAVQWYRKAAEQGHAKAQYRLADKLYYGKGCQQNKEEALNWYKKAAAKGNADAQKILDILPINTSQAVQNESSNDKIINLRKAAERGDVKAQYVLAEQLYYGKNCKKNSYEAVKWYRKAAEQGHIESEYSLAYCLDKGIGCLLNYKEAVQCYRKAAEQGHAKAQYRLADKLYYGKGCQQNKEEAINWYKKAATKGNADAQKILDILPINTSQAVQQENANDKIINLRKAAERGDADAQYALAKCLKDEKEAMDRLCLILSPMAMTIGRGCSKEDKEAISWYKKAAEQGHMKAQYNLAYCLENGKGCEKDMQGALKWYKRAAEQGNRSAESDIERIENTFNSSHQSSISTQVAAQSSGCLLPILVTLVIIGLIAVL